MADEAQVEAAARAARAEFARGYLPDLWPRVARAALTAAGQVDTDDEVAKLRKLLAGAADIIESLKTLIYDRHALYATAVEAQQIPVGTPELIRLDEVLAVLMAGVSVGLDEPPTVTRG